MALAHNKKFKSLKNTSTLNPFRKILPLNSRPPRVVNKTFGNVRGALDNSTVTVSSAGRASRQNCLELYDTLYYYLHSHHTIVDDTVPQSFLSRIGLGGLASKR